MITLKVNKKKTKIALFSHYFYRKRLASINGAVWNPEMKAWIAPFSSLPQIEKEFKGELYYKTPKWFIEGTEPVAEQRIIHDKSITAPVLKLPVYDYQSDGIRFMIDRINLYGFVMNSDDVGLGKTICTIGTLQWYINNDQANHILIICKKSLKYQWKSEIYKFADWEHDIFITGEKPKERKEAYNGFANSKKGILITNYNNFINDLEEIKNCPVDIATIDEVHSVKAKNGVMHDNIAEVVQGKKLILLTGTPIMSKIDDIYGILGIADKHYFGSYKDFESKYLVVDYGIYGRQVVGAKNIDILYSKIHDIMIRRTTDEVSIELPDVIEKPVIVPMDKTQKKIQDILDIHKEKLNHEKDALLNQRPLTDEIWAKIEAMNEKEKMYIAIQQYAADNPATLFELFDSPIKKEILSKIPKTYKTSNKNEATIDLIDDIISSGEKVIIFTNFLKPALILKEEIEKKLKTTVLMYTGNENDKVREENKRKFMTTNEYNILMGNEAMSEGLNLQKAKCIINYEQADTYADKNQRMGRIRRVGSNHNTVIVYDMITENSFDEIRLQKIEKDRILAESLVG